MSQEFDRQNDHLAQRGFFEDRVLTSPPYLDLQSADDVLTAIRFNENHEQAHILARDALAQKFRADLLRLERDPVVQGLARTLHEGGRLLCAAVAPESETAPYQRALLYLTSSGFLVCRSCMLHENDEAIRTIYDQRSLFERVIPGRHLAKEQLGDFVVRGVRSDHLIENLLSHGEYHGMLDGSAAQDLRNLLQRETLRHAGRAA
jgi:hypothetical protein